MNLPPVTPTRGATPRRPDRRHQGVLQPGAARAALARETRGVSGSGQVRASYLHWTSVFTIV